jgi:CubicO group peptidase (beta-lactamase class C family)
VNQNEDEETITSLVRDIPHLLREARVPGLSIALVRDAAIVWGAAFGQARTQPPQPATTGTIFQAASLSKPLFAYAVLGLAERGDLNLDTPLTDYLPDPYVPDDPLLSTITARRVLCHTTGWPNWRPEGGLLVRERAPGEAVGYSGEGYNYLQMAVEHIVGQPLDAYMREAVLEPLGMRASSYRWAGAGAPAVAAAHDRAGQPIVPYVGARPEASSSLHTTPADYARFLCALLDTTTGSGHLRTASVAEMLRPQVTIGPSVAWGLGWGLEASGDHGAFWHWGDNPGYKSLTVAEPAQRTGTVIMTNGDGGLRVCEQLARLILGHDHPAFAWLAATFYGAPTLAAL